ATQAALPRPPAHEAMAGHSTADELFIGAGGYGLHVPNASIPMVAAMASAAVAALLVLIIGFALAGRKLRASPAETATRTVAPSGASSGAASQEQGGKRGEPRLAETDAPTQDPLEASFLEMLMRTPTSKRALMGLAALYAERRNARAFSEIATQIQSLSGGRGPNWLHIATLGRQLDPDNPLYTLSDEGAEEEKNTSAEAESDTLPAHLAAVPQQADRSGLEPVVTEGPPPASTTETVPAGKPFPVDAADALNALDMALPPRVGQQAQPGEVGVALDGSAIPLEAEHGASHDAPHDTSPVGQASLNARERDAAGAPEADASHADDTAQRAASAPAVMSGLGAARFGPLNLAFDLDLPGAGKAMPAGTPPGTVATPAQPMFSPEEMAKIARNKIELAAEYIALGDFGGARTLIYEVIESNDPGTRDEAKALLATLAPLS
ncbi:MAG: pilus assembly protein FimV, partial [Paraburkholderia sp.]|nr:pilus assembly protein FimV [Paraburkholderia sp.]